MEANSDLPLKKDSTPYLIDWNLVSGTEDMPQIREQAVIASQSDSDDETEDSNEHKEVEKQSEKEDEEIKEISEREPVYYPLSTVERFPVTDTSVSWEVRYIFPFIVSETLLHGRVAQSISQLLCTAYF